MAHTSGSNNMRLARNTMVLYVRMLFQMLVYLYTSRALLSVLGASDYGLYDVVGGLVAIFVTLNNSMITTTQRYLTYALGTEREGYVSEVFSVSLLVHFVIALLVFLLCETVGLYYLRHFMVLPEGRMAAAEFVFHCSLLVAVLTISTIPFNSLIIAKEEMTAFAFISMADILLKLMLVLALQYVGADRLMFYAASLVAETLIVRIIYVVYCHWVYKDVRFRRYKHRSLYLEILVFAGWSMVGNVALACNTHGLNLVLNKLGGTLLNAARGVAFQVQAAIMSFTASFQTAINPQITKMYASGRVKEMHTLILRSARFSFLLVLFVTIPLGIETATVLSLWLVKVPDHAVTFTRLLLCVAMVEAVANPLSVGAAATGRIRNYHLLVGVTLLAALPLALLATRFTRIPEVVLIVQLVVALVVQCVRLLVCRNLYHLSLRSFTSDVVMRVVIVVVVTLPIVFVAHHYWSGSLWGSFLVCALGWLVMAFAVVLFGLTPSERRTFLNYLFR